MIAQSYTYLQVLGSLRQTESRETQAPGKHLRRGTRVPLIEPPSGRVDQESGKRTGVRQDGRTTEGYRPAWRRGGQIQACLLMPCEPVSSRVAALKCRCEIMLATGWRV